MHKYVASRRIYLMHVKLTETQLSQLNKRDKSTVGCPTQHITGYFGDNFTGQMTQPTVSQH